MAMPAPKVSSTSPNATSIPKTVTAYPQKFTLPNAGMCQIDLFANADLPSSNLLPGLYDMLNRAFADGHEGPKGHYLPASRNRLQTIDQFVTDCGPESFSIVISQATPLDPLVIPPSKEGEEAVAESATPNPRVLATASARPWKAYVPTAERLQPGPGITVFWRPYLDKPSPEHVIHWELKLMGVDPSFQRLGIAGGLMGLIEDEILKRVDAEWTEDLRKGREVGDPQAFRDVRLVMQTLKEINYDFYLKHNYYFLCERYWPPGTWDSRDGFTTIYMEKKLRLGYMQGPNESDGSDEPWEPEWQGTYKYQT
ncbi:hypothetical protein MMC25_006034 [Agyrium rufum]|nr:hypothetical protein [Agyrium rufum]